MPSFGPFTCSNGPGSVTVDNRSCVLYDTGVQVGQNIQLIQGVADATFTGGRNDATWNLVAQAYDATGNQLLSRELGQQRLTQLHMDWSVTPPGGTARMTISFESALYAGQTQSCVISGSFTEAVFCQYGTQPTQTGTFAYYLTPALIDTWLTTVGAVWLAPAFTALWFTTINTQTVCANGPPPMPPINLDLLTAPISVLEQLLISLAWPSICQCVPGTPAPIPFPPPTATEPVGWPQPITFDCQNTDVCAAIVQIQQAVAAISGNLSAVNELVTLLQRYQAPFAYVKGAVHSGLTGTGSFQIPRLCGISILLTAAPGGLQTFTGNPTYITDLGWISTGDANGMLEEVRLTRQNTVWLPLRMTDATTFNYALRDGVAINATELEAEV